MMTTPSPLLESLIRLQVHVAEHLWFREMLSDVEVSYFEAMEARPGAFMGDDGEFTGPTVDEWKANGCKLGIPDVPRPRRILIPRFD